MKAFPKSTTELSECQHIKLPFLGPQHTLTNTWAYALLSRSIKKKKMFREKAIMWNFTSIVQIHTLLSLNIHKLISTMSSLTKHSQINNPIILISFSYPCKITPFNIYVELSILRHHKISWTKVISVFLSVN